MDCLFSILIKSVPVRAVSDPYVSLVGVQNFLGTIGVNHIYLLFRRRNLDSINIVFVKNVRCRDFSRNVKLDTYVIFKCM